MVCICVAERKSPGGSVGASLGKGFLVSQWVSVGTQAAQTWGRKLFLHLPRSKSCISTPQGFEFTGRDANFALWVRSHSQKGNGFLNLIIAPSSTNNPCQELMANKFLSWKGRRGRTKEERNRKRREPAACSGSRL